jgi:hypothetical protein
MALPLVRSSGSYPAATDPVTCAICDRWDRVRDREPTITIGVAAMQGPKMR